MANLERTYNVPLRKEFMKAPKYKRTMKAVKALREFLQRHMKCENVKIGRYANMELHKCGRRHPPHHIQVNAVKTTEKIKGKDIEIVKAELVGAPVEKKEPSLEKKPREEKKEEIKGENIVAEKPFEKSLQGKEIEEKEEKKILEKEPKKKKVKEPTTKIVDKEQSIKQERQDIVNKSEKPIHEGKR